MSSTKISFLPSVLGKKGPKTRPKGIGKIFAPTVGKITNGKKAGATKFGGKRIF